MFYLLIAIVVFDFIIGRTLSVLNASREKLPVPALLADIYSEDKHREQTRYSRANRRLSWVTNSVSLVIMLLMLCLGGFRWLDNCVHLWTLPIASELWCEVAMALLFFLIISLAEELISLPLSVYQNFVIEQRFGFNKTTPVLFLTDWLKSTLLQMLLTAAVLTIMVVVYHYLPDWFWLIVWAAVSAISLFFSYFYSQLIVPLFNKQTRLEVGELRSAIEKFASEAGFPLSDIYVLDSSKRTTHANAYFTGFGKNKRIVLYDSLIEQLSTEEIVAVLAHEIGHNKRRHNIRQLISGLLQSLLLFFLLSLVLKYNLLSSAIGCEESLHVNLFLFYIVYSPLNMLLSLLTNYLSRRHEYQADEFALTHGMAVQLSSALKKMSVNSLSNPNPHPTFVFFHYSHPTLLSRLEHLSGSQTDCR